MRFEHSFPRRVPTGERDDEGRGIRRAIIGNRRVGEQIEAGLRGRWISLTSGPAIGSMDHSDAMQLR